MTIPQPEIMQMFRKSESRVIYKCKFQICNQISLIDNPFFVIRCQISDYLINKLTPHGITKIKKNYPKVTANVLDYIYSAITIGVKLINGRKSHCVFNGIRILLVG